MVHSLLMSESLLLFLICQTGLLLLFELQFSSFVLLLFYNPLLFVPSPLLLLLFIPSPLLLLLFVPSPLLLLLLDIFIFVDLLLLELLLSVGELPLLVPFRHFLFLSVSQLLHFEHHLFFYLLSFLDLFRIPHETSLLLLPLQFLDILIIIWINVVWLLMLSKISSCKVWRRNLVVIWFLISLLSEIGEVRLRWLVS